jgi:hypothetical protein
MVIDLRGLEGVPESLQRAFHARDLPKQGVTLTGPFKGTLSLEGQDQAFAVDGRFVENIQLGAFGSALDLNLPTPVPGYKGVNALRLALRYDDGAKEWLSEMPGGGWFAKSYPIKGRVGSWMSQIAADIAIRLRRPSVGWQEGFPLELTGVSEPMKWTADDRHHMFAGVFPDGNGGLHLVLVPSSHSPPFAWPSGNGDASKGLRLFGFRQAAFGMDTDYTATPLFLALPISGPGRTWRAAVQWDPFKTGNPTITNRLRTDSVLEYAWNFPVQNAIAGAKVQQSGQPVTALPWFGLDKKLADDIRPVLVFDLSRPAEKEDEARATLRHIHFCHDKKIPISAEFGWQPAGTSAAPWTLQQPWPMHEDALVFTGALKELPPIRWTGEPSQGDGKAWSARLTEAFRPINLPESADLLVAWHADGTVARKDGKADEWVVWGSLEFRLPKSGAAELECRLQGEWTESRCDVYPETVLILKDCEVRTSATTDAAGRDLDAAFGVRDTGEDEMQRESDPLRFPRKARAGGRICELRISHLTMPGRNAVIRLEVRSDDLSALGEESVFLQLRPFFIGVVRPAEIDQEAGRLIASWVSNDPEGAQWRVPDATVAVTLQPQAVGEAMERGVRFWQDMGGTADPWLDPARPLAYRFSPPTQIVVRPSVRERRYNKSPSNLGAVFANAKVESFTTEMVYPVEARFEVSRQGLPDVRVTETASLLGRPAENLEPLPSDARPGDGLLNRWLRVVYSGDAAVYATRVGTSLAGPLAKLRDSHSAARTGFSARLAQFHLFDPWSPQGGLRLKDGMRFRIRDTQSGAPPLANPLPQWKKPYGAPPTQLLTDLASSQKKEIHQLAKGPAFLSAAGDWGREADSIPAGVVHTMEFASELVAVLRNPVATGGEIESLALSALGASGSMSVSFDEGRTTFIAETSFGQLSRLIKVRIGRVGVLWNKAKHILVYERTTVATKQFADEQEYGDAEPGQPKATRGWPVLRKTEEYVEPVEPLRYFDREEQKDVNRAGFLVASEFVTPRIYVNGAWGRDLGHGYEIPLWSVEDKSGFYPKPFFALQARAAGEQISRCWHEEPHELVFYTNTEKGTGNDPDKWEAKAGVDCAHVLSRLPLMTGAAFTAQETLDAKGMPAPRLGATRRPRFDMAVRSDGKVDLQHGRGETHMLAALDIISVARTSELSPADAAKLPQAALQALQAASVAGARLQSAAALRSQGEALIARAAEQLLRAGGDCAKVKGDLHLKVGGLFDNAKAELRRGVDSAKIPATFPADALPFTKALDDVQQQLLRHDAVLRAPFDKIRADLEAMRRSAQQGGQDVRATAQKQLEAAREVVSAVAKSQKDQVGAFFDQMFVLPTGGVKETLASVVAQLATALDDLEKAFAAGPPNFTAALDACAKAQAQLGKLALHATLGGLAGQLEAAVRMLSGFLRDGQTQVDDAWQHVKTGATAAVAQAKVIVKSITAAVSQLEADAKALKDQLKAAVTDKVDLLLGEALTAIADANTPLDAALSKALACVDKIHDAAQAAAGQAASDVIGAWRTAVDATVGDKSALRAKVVAADAELRLLADNSLQLARQLVAAVENTAGNWIDVLRDNCLKLVSGIDCTLADDMASKLRDALSEAEVKLRDRVAEQAGKIFDEQTRQQLAELEKGAKEFANQTGQAIKLVKAIGELPELPTLTFNADRAEYLFDDVKKQIETSPFAAKLREIDSGLKQLGISVPARQLLDQIVPDSLKGLNVDFNKVFRNIGGLDFEGLFKRFKLPDLKSEQIKITQGVDKATRSAWVTTRVRADFNEQQSLFEFAGLAVTLARMKLRADSDMRIGVDGQHSSTTDALLQADWGLHFGGAALARFREVSVQFDGTSFKFNIEPAKVELHPALKFVDEFARRFTPELPPAIELEKDSRGIPVGARATMVTEIKDLPPLGVVSIGPLRIVSGLGLRMNNAGQFVVKASVSVGTKASPVWVQIGYLGGGMWLEAQATYEKSISYSATVGLAIGCMKALNVASIARGSFALLLFAYAEISNAGGSLRVGFSLSGSARILGIANASILLLLEAEHRDGGTEGRGVLDVSIDICWCYTLKVRRDVKHQIS